MLAITPATPFTASQSQQDVCQDKSLGSVSVSSVLTVHSEYRDQVRISSSTTITVPATWPGARLLLDDDGSQWTALGCFLPLTQYAYRAGPPSVTKTSSKVVVSDFATTTAYPADVYYARLGDWQAGLWTIAKDQSQLNVTFDGLAESVPVPVDWTLKLTAPGLTITKPKDFPTTETGNGELTWRFRSARSTDPDEMTVAALTLPSRLRWEWDDWAWPTGMLTDILNILGYGLAFYLLVFYLSGRFSQRTGASRELWETARAARQIALFGIVLYLLDSVNDGLVHLFNEYLVPQNFIATGQTCLAFAAGMYLYYSARRKRRYSRRFLVLTTLAGLTPALVLRGVTDFPVGLVPLILSMFGFYAGVALWGWRMWVSITERVAQASVRLSKTALRVSYSAALAFAALGTIDPVITSSRDWSHWYLTANTSRSTWVALSSVYNGESNWLDGDLQAALWLLVAVAFVAVIRMAAPDHPDVFFGTGRLELWSMAVLLGFAFEGVWGYFAGFPVPVGLLLLILGFRYVAVTTKGTPTIASKLWMSGKQTVTGERLLTLHKVAFYDAAERIAELNSQLTSISNSDLSMEAINLKRTQLLQEIDGLKKRVPVSAAPRRGIARIFGKPRQQHLVLPQEYDPARVLLDTGPKTTWWDNGAQAVRSALPIIVIAAGYFTYRDLHDGTIAPLAFPYGLTDAAFTIGGNVLAWVIVAFVFGACLPYIWGVRGPVKGVILGVVHAAALGLADWLFYAIGESLAPNYLVESLVFLFFLATLGVLIDIRTLYEYGGSSGLFGRLYRLGDTRAAVTYIAAIIVTVLGIWQQANTLNQETQQRAQIAQQVVQNINSMYGNAP